MRMIFIVLTQFVYSYGIAMWGGAYETYLQLLKTIISLLLKISLRRYFSTNIIQII